jgi:TPR repeat protein
VCIFPISKNAKSQVDSELERLYMQSLEEQAREGDARAQAAIGDEYYAAKHFVEASKWYQKAAEQGERRAQNQLGQMYFLGQGVQQDYSEAAKWFEKAASQGHDLAKLMLGQLYLEGNGVRKDLVQAYMWTALMDPEQRALVKTLAGVDPLEEIEKQMTETQIEEAKRLTRTWEPTVP